MSDVQAQNIFIGFGLIKQKLCSNVGGRRYISSILSELFPNYISNFSILTVLV